MKPNDAKARLFRKVALDRLSSPEQLDTMVNVVTLRSWVAVVPFLVLLAMALAWSVFGTIPSKVVGRSILLQTEGLREVTTGSAGRILEAIVDDVVDPPLRVNVADVDVSQLEISIGRFRKRLVVDRRGVLQASRREQSYRRHSVTSRSNSKIRCSTSASSASISCNGRGGWYWKNTRLKLIS